MITTWRHSAVRKRSIACLPSTKFVLNPLLLFPRPRPPLFHAFPNNHFQVSQKTFIANITTQVIERHIVRGLENIFSPIVVNAMSDVEVETIAAEPSSAKRQREFLEERINKLKKIFRSVMGGGGK
jgi:hypothetical protein